MFTPTPTELKELGFENEEECFFHDTGNHFTIQYDFIDNEWLLVSVDDETEFYPQSLEDIKTLIKLFTPN